MRPRNLGVVKRPRNALEWAILCAACLPIAAADAIHRACERRRRARQADAVDRETL